MKISKMLISGKKEAFQDNLSVHTQKREILVKIHVAFNYIIQFN